MSYAGLPDGFTVAEPKTAYAGLPDGFSVHEPAKQAPDFTLGRWAGLEGRNLIQGAAALPATLLDIPAQAYNTGADLIQGKDKGFRYNEMNQNVASMLDKAGLPRPETTGEQVGSAIAQSVAGAGSGMGLGKALQSAPSAVARGVGQSLTAMPGKQLASSVMSGGAVAGAQQAGAPWWAQALAGTAAGTLPYLNPSSLVGAKSVTAPEQEALDSGYKLPPATMKDPSLLSKILGGWSGKVKTQQASSVANQELTNGIAAQELGLPNDTTLDDNVFSRIRSEAGRAYQAVKSSVPEIVPDEQFRADAASLGNLNSDLAKDFPELVRNDDISSLSENFANKKSFSTAAGMDAIKTLRASATKNLQAIGDPQKSALGFAQRQAADSLDGLIERNLSGPDTGDLVPAYKAARQLIAKSYDVEAATNPGTGDVSAAKIAQLGNRRPLSGGLDTVAKMGNAFPKATQVPAKFGGAEPLSVLDMAYAAAPVAGGAMSGRLGEGAALGAAALSRPLARALILSKAYQGALQKTGPLIDPTAATQAAPINAALARALQNYGANQ